MVWETISPYKELSFECIHFLRMCVLYVICVTPRILITVKQLYLVGILGLLFAVKMKYDTAKYSFKSCCIIRIASKWT